MVPEEGAEPQPIIAPCLCGYLNDLAVTENSIQAVSNQSNIVTFRSPGSRWASFILLNVADFKGIQGQTAFWQGTRFEVRMSVGWCTLGAI